MIVFRDSEILRAEQTEYGPRGHGRHVAALVVQPLRIALLRDAVADEGRPRGTQRYQLIGIHRQVAGILAPKRSLNRTVFEEVAGHPVILTGVGEILKLLSEVAPVRFGAAFAGGTNQRDRKASVERHSHQGCFPKPRNTLNADTLGVHCLVGFQIVEAARCAPAPGPQRAPVLRLARLSLGSSDR